MSSSKLDYRLLGPGVFIVATCYGLARYAYGLFIPVFREVFSLSDSWLAFVAAAAYANYFIATLVGIYFSSKLSPRTSVVVGGLFATVGLGLVAISSSPLQLACGVAIAGVSPGLAYTPFSEIVSKHVTADRQRFVYSVINSGTSLGVMISGPLAITFNQNWRFAWAFFGVFSLFSTLWCGYAIPKKSTTGAASLERFKLSDFAGKDRLRILGVALMIGIATSIYWTFAVDLVTANVADPIRIGDWSLDNKTFSQIFWTMVGLSGFAGVFAGAIVNRLGVLLSLAIFQLGISLATLSLTLVISIAAVLCSGLIFGAFFVFMAATLGMWSMDLFKGQTTLGFGLTFLALSLGQFVGPSLVGLLANQLPLATLFMLSALVSFGTVLFLPFEFLSARSKGLAD
ncbi:MAG: YbfB/YjiJ family MFS transporter [Comamonadaceae bacterium]|nr:MAG: YbfB/YjiJ family MFS transporter [Comamonadaceae bacterium]